MADNVREAVIWVLLIALLILPGMVGCSYLPSEQVPQRPEQIGGAREED